MSQTFYFYAQTEPIFQKVLVHLQKKQNFNIIKVDIELNSKIQSHNKKLNYNDIAFKPYRNLSIFFPKNSFQEIVAKFILYLFQKRKGSRKRVMYVDAGKNELFFQHLRKDNNEKSFDWVLQLSNLKNIFLKK